LIYKEIPSVFISQSVKVRYYTVLSKEIIVKLVKLFICATYYDADRASDAAQLAMDSDFHDLSSVDWWRGISNTKLGISFMT
ncbi:MAG TPA: hypothetical protein PLA31_08820, partial [Clostridia bacterium]|nr:hypothetical protein [Clostridia bacterium]